MILTIRPLDQERRIPKMEKGKRPKVRREDIGGEHKKFLTEQIDLSQLR